MSSLDNIRLLLERIKQNDITINITLICESFLHGPNKDNTIKNTCKISGYDLICMNRQQKFKGGVAIYIKTAISML
jgi:hypothetical protein